jgi:hypothetical protein
MHPKVERIMMQEAIRLGKDKHVSIVAGESRWLEILMRRVRVRVRMHIRFAWRKRAISEFEILRMLQVRSPLDINVRSYRRIFPDGDAPDGWPVILPIRWL